MNVTDEAGDTTQMRGTSTDVPPGGKSDDLNWIERNSRTITTLATLSIPLVLGVFTFVANSAINQQKLGKEYTDLAVKLLAEPPSEGETALRGYAVDVLDKVGPVGLDDEVKQALQDGGLTGLATAAATESELEVARAELDAARAELDKARTDADAARKDAAAAVSANQSIESEFQVAVTDLEKATALSSRLELDVLELLADSTALLPQGCVVEVSDENALAVDGTNLGAGSFDAVAIRETTNLRFLQLVNDRWVRVTDTVSLSPECGGA